MTPRKLSPSELAETIAILERGCFDVSAGKLLSHIAALTASLAQKDALLRDFVRTFPGAFSMLRKAHGHPEFDPDCTYCFLLARVEAEGTMPQPALTPRQGEEKL